MKTLYITDLDGTLLNNDALMSGEASELVSELTERGAIISVATARTPATVEPILADTLTANELVVMTGAAIWNRAQSRFSSIKLLPAEDVEVMLKVFSDRGLRPFCYVLNEDNRFLDVYHPAKELTEHEKLFVYERAQLTLKGFHLGECCPPTSYGRVALFFGMGSKEEIVDVAELLSAKTDCYISYYKDTYTPELWLLEIFAPGVSKAQGVLDLKKRLGADRVVAFGDNLNDIPMLQAADVAVAVANALPEVKAIADCVIGYNTECSVPRFIRRDFENG